MTLTGQLTNATHGRTARQLQLEVHSFFAGHRSVAIHALYARALHHPTVNQRSYGSAAA